MSAVTELWSDPLLRRALIEVVIVGALGGWIGVHVVLRRLSFFTVAIAHGAFPGVVLASLAGVSLLLGAGGFAVVIVLVTAALGTVGRLDDSSAIGVVLAGSLALGTLLLSTTNGSSRDLTAFLVGSVLSVGTADVVATGIIGAVVVVALLAVHKELVLGAFDPEGAAAMGYPGARLDLLLLAAVAAVVATAVPAVGVVQAVALLVTPASTARLWSDRVLPTMALSAAIGALSGALGLMASRWWDVAAGGSIVMASSALFVVSFVLAPRHGIRARPRHPRPRRHELSDRAGLRAAAPAPARHGG